MIVISIISMFVVTAKELEDIQDFQHHCIFKFYSNTDFPSVRAKVIVGHCPLVHFAYNYVVMLTSELIASAHIFVQ